MPNSFGYINQMVFKTIDDALYYLYSKENKITIEKSNDTFSWVTCQTNDKISYYEIKTVKPLHYGE